MNKQTAAETLKKFISPNMKAKDYTSDSLKEAVTKAIEVLSDKTEYVKRSTYRKLKAENVALEETAIEAFKDYDAQDIYVSKLKEDLEELQKHYDTLVADASEYRMKIRYLKGRNLLERIFNKDLH